MSCNIQNSSAAWPLRHSMRRRQLYLAAARLPPMTTGARSGCIAFNRNTLTIAPWVEGAREAVEAVVAAVAER